MELDFISARYADFELPPEKKYLLKYFETAIERQFLSYYLLFGNYRRFTDHTGYVCIRRYLREMRARLEKLEKVHDKARREGDIPLVVQIESGQFKL